MFTFPGSGRLSSGSQKYSVSVQQESLPSAGGLDGDRYRIVASGIDDRLPLLRPPGTGLEDRDVAANPVPRHRVSRRNRGPAG